ncbi:MAG: hypothetical protein ACTHNK_20540, partial [Thermomicrobiales bacterium]
MRALLVCCLADAWHSAVLLLISNIVAYWQHSMPQIFPSRLTTRGWAAYFHSPARPGSRTAQVCITS